MFGCHHQLDGHEFEQALGVDGQGSLACCSPCIIRFTYNSVGFSVFRVVRPSLLLNSRTFHQIVIANIQSVQFSCSVVSDSATPWTAARQASLSITNSRSLLKLMSFESVMPSNHLILCRPLLLPPSIFPSIRVFSNKSVLHIRWPKYWSFQLQHQSFQRIFRTFRMVGSPCSPRDSQLRVVFNTAVQKHQFFSTQLCL